MADEHDQRTQFTQVGAGSLGDVGRQFRSQLPE